MKRRQALKNLGWATGYAVATPTIISLVQSCKSENAVTWVPDFFTQEQGNALEKLVDIILPKTDTPSASEVNVHVLIDKFVNEVMDEEEKGQLKMAFGKFLDKSKEDASKETYADLTAEDLEATLASTLKISKEEVDKHAEAFEAMAIAKMEGKEFTLDDAATRYSFAANLRDTAVWAYKNTEKIGEKVLAYDSIPGVPYIPCGNVDELTGGKAWSL
jgi:hypothetical protein